jgi:hypothetical protein
MKKIILITISGLILVLFILSFRPISISRDNSASIIGVIDTVYLDTTKDLVLKISGDQRTFYINRATDEDLDIPLLVSTLPSKTATIFYADQWTVLDPFGSTRHITQLMADQNLIFTELE